MNWQKHFKSKQQAMTHIFELLKANPNCAGADGLITVIMGKNYYEITPIKKKK